MPAAELKALDPARLTNVDLVIKSYGSLLRLPWLANTSWRVAVLDEAQAIKNPGAKQTQAAKKLDAQVKIALTEPATLVLLGAGLAAIATWTRIARRRNPNA